MMCSHVHDFIYWGNKEFEEEVLRKLKERSEVGREEVGELDISV